MCNIFHVIVHFLPKKHRFLPKRKKEIFAQVFPKVRKSRQILKSHQNSIWHMALNFRPSSNFSAKALCTFAELLPPCSRHSSYLSLKPLPAVVYFFQVSVLFSIENARLWPINFGYLSKIYTLFFYKYEVWPKAIIFIFGVWEIQY